MWPLVEAGLLEALQCSQRSTDQPRRTEQQLPHDASMRNIRAYGGVSRECRNRTEGRPVVWVSPSLEQPC
jgi:hypothetical protein